MRWELKPGAAGHETYHLYKDGKKLVAFSINSFSKMARVECTFPKRIFQIKKEGFLRNKTVLRNEYGVKIGVINYKEHLVQINDDRFFFQARHVPHAELIIFRESKEKPILSCNHIPGDVNHTSDFVEYQEMGEDLHPGLLMSVCWYMFRELTNLPISASQKIQAKDPAQPSSIKHNLQ